MRIVGGALRGKKLHPVKASVIRPTSDRTRESIFNILGIHFPHRAVLDLFAGTGALGIEAISRGAEQVCFLEKNREALVLLRRNLRTCGLESRCRVIPWDAVKSLKCLDGFPAGFDLVFMDPPYGKQMVRPALGHLHRSGCLRAGARVVVEHDKTEDVTPDIDVWRMEDQRRYGQTRVTFLNYR